MKAIVGLLVGTLLVASCQGQGDSAGTLPPIKSDAEVVRPAEVDSSLTLDPNSDGIGGARQVLDAYYDALANGEYDLAYSLWADSGRASNQPSESFRDSLASTSSIAMQIGNGRLEGAAGSQYAEFAVVVETTSRQQGSERFEGTYVLRRSVVDGATASQRQWRIYSAQLQQVD